MPSPDKFRRVEISVQTSLAGLRLVQQRTGCEGEFGTENHFGQVPAHPFFEDVTGLRFYSPRIIGGDVADNIRQRTQTTSPNRRCPLHDVHNQDPEYGPCSVSTEHPAFPRDNIGDIRLATLIEKCFDKFGIPTTPRRMRFR